MQDAIIIVGLWLFAVPFTSILFMLGIMVYDAIMEEKRLKEYYRKREEMKNEKR